MAPSRLGRACCALAAAVWLAGFPSAQAQDSNSVASADTANEEGTDRSAAVVLFRQGRELMLQKRYRKACRKFEESLRLLRGAGTQLNLAQCYEQIGKLASAWTHYLEVLAVAKRQGRRDREKLASARLSAVEPRLTRLVIVPPQKTVRGLQIKRGRIVVKQPQWRTPIPVDPGAYWIQASAPGKQLWRHRVDAFGQGRTLTVSVPPLRDAPAERGAPIRPVPDESSESSPGWSAYQTGAVVLAGISVIGVGLGTAFGTLAITKKGQADEYCLRSDACFDEGADLMDEARGFGNASTVAFGIGAAALVGATVLWLLPSDTASDDSGPSARAVPLVDQRAAGVLLVGRW